MLTDEDKQAIKKEIFEKFVSPEKREIPVAQSVPDPISESSPIQNPESQMNAIEFSSSLFDHISQTDHQLLAELDDHQEDGDELESAGIGDRMTRMESRVDNLQSCLENVVTLIKHTLPSSGAA